VLRTQRMSVAAAEGAAKWSMGVTMSTDGISADGTGHSREGAWQTPSHAP
jgi:hypothetical protein